MITQLDRLEMVLKIHGCHMTVPRQVVFEALAAVEAVTMAELLQHCPTVDRVSVYRTIALFEQLHIVQRIQTGWKYKLELSGDFAPHHHHASCERCGQIIDLPKHREIEQQLSSMASTIGFDMHEHSLEIRGVCKHCLKGLPKTFSHSA